MILNLNTGNIENSNVFIGIIKPSEDSPPSGAYQALRYVSYESIESGEPMNSRAYLGHTANKLLHKRLQNFYGFKAFVLFKIKIAIFNKQSQ